jgi:hypothetical protein
LYLGPAKVIGDGSAQQISSGFSMGRRSPVRVSQRWRASTASISVFYVGGSKNWRLRHLSRSTSPTRRPRHIAADLAEWIDANGMSHVRGAPLHPQTQGKIERWHQTLKNRILLENYFLPGDLERQIEAFVEHYNHRRYHESLGNVTPADAYFGRASAIIEQRERIKRQTIQLRRLQHRKLAA